MVVYVTIDQKHFHKDSLYDAWVSGYEVQLDSIKVYQRTEKLTNFVNNKSKDKRWGIGVHAGYGASKDGLSPYVGVGISYNFVRW